MTKINLEQIPDGWWLHVTPLARLKREDWVLAVLKRGKTSWVTETCKSGFITAQDAYEWGLEFIEKQK